MEREATEAAAAFATGIAISLEEAGHWLRNLAHDFGEYAVVVIGVGGGYRDVVGDTVDEPRRAAAVGARASAAAFQ